PRRLEEAPADDADHGSLLADGPDLWADFQAFPRSSAGVGGRVREGVVQADPSRYGPDYTLPGPARSEGGPIVAGSGSRGGSSTHRRTGYCRSEGQDSGVRSVDFSIGDDCLGCGSELPRFRQARRRQWSADSPHPAKGLGGEPAGGTGKGAAETGGRPE